MAETVDDTTDLSFEEARDELVAIVGQLEAGNVPLAQSLAQWVRGETLAATCQRWLDGAKTRIDAARAEAADTP